MPAAAPAVKRVNRVALLFEFRKAVDRRLGIIPGITARVLFIGGWHLPRLLRSSWRVRAPVTARYDSPGFRVAADLPAQ